MQKWMLMAVVALTLTVSGYCAEQENPYKKAKVGDWIEHKMSNDMGAMKMESSMRKEVTAISEKEVTLKMTTEAMGQKNTMEVKIPLDKPYDPMNPGAENPDLKVEKLGEGDETVTVGGKDYKAHWYSVKVTGKTQGMEMDTTSKVWISKDVPLEGIVKMETTTAKPMPMKVNMELTGAGSK